VAEQLVVSNNPAIIVPDGLPALYGERPFPVTVGAGEMYFMPERCDLEPRVRAATLLALVGETNKSAGKLLRLSEFTAKRAILEGMHSFALPDRFTLTYYAFSQAMCQRTRSIPPYDNLLPRMVEVVDAMGREGVADAAEATHIKPVTVGTYQSQVSKRTGVKGGRNRLVLMGIMSGQIGNFAIVDPEVIRAATENTTS